MTIAAVQTIVACRTDETVAAAVAMEFVGVSITGDNVVEIVAAPEKRLAGERQVLDIWGQPFRMSADRAKYNIESLVGVSITLSRIVST